MVHHHAITPTCLAWVDATSDLNNDTTGLMPGDDRAFRLRQPARHLLAGRATIGIEVTTAHARGLHLKDDIPRPGDRVWK